MFTFCACCAVCFDQARIGEFCFCLLLKLILSKPKIVWTLDWRGLDMKLSEGNSTESRYNSFTCVVSHLGAVDVKLDMQAGPFTSLVKLSIHLDSCQERVFHVKRPENNKTFISYFVFVSAISNRPIKHSQNINSNGSC